MVHYRQFIVIKTLGPAHFLVQMEDKDAILKRCAEHFESVLSHPSSVNGNAISR